MKKILRLLFVCLPCLVMAQTNLPQPIVFTSEQDHQDMMNQLGIKKLRPGPSGNEADANHANYDEALANPFPVLPDILTMKNGTRSIWTASE